ncbi:uncharacterized protein LOC125816219 [Solanum verrucosum]|uniref:uncharacterized protein LOC125816219 n=1 Tax=Solanum verrucosum TaxID=315347 RepID=UPI0020D0AE30|nr:uncharacterized protein LOC125816219 [Solanum verrucosum]
MPLIDKGLDLRSLDLRPLPNLKLDQPKLGLKFDSDENALRFYNEYARRVGLGVRKEI